MIDLTRLNGHRLIVNPDLIKLVEATPDTTLTLITGEKLLVHESCDELVALIAEWRSRILTGAWPDSAQAHTARAVLTRKNQPRTPGNQARTTEN